MTDHVKDLGEGQSHPGGEGREVTDHVKDLGEGQSHPGGEGSD